MDAPNGTINLMDIMDKIEAKRGEPKVKDKKLPPLRYPPRPDGAKKVTDLPPATEEEQAERIAPFRRIVERGQHEAIVWFDRQGKRRSLKVDGFTASTVCQVFDALTPKNRGVLMAMEPVGIINMTFKSLPRRK